MTTFERNPIADGHRRTAPISRWMLVVACSIACALPTGCQKSLLTKVPIPFVAGRNETPFVPSEESPESSLDGFLATDAPRRVLHPQEDRYWDVPLEDILQLALANVAIIRDRNQFMSPSNPVLVSPELVPSGFDPAIQEAGAPFGGRGVAVAEADYDPVVTLNNIWGKSQLIQNNDFLSGGVQQGNVLEEDNAAFTARVQKLLSSGGVVSIGQYWNYSLNNAPRLYPSVYTGQLRGEYRQPLWAGAGSDFVSIAGPLYRNFPGAVLNQGVVIARINTRISVLDFESRVQTLLKNVEDAWWDLALAYKSYEAEMAGQETARRIWEQIKTRTDAGLEGVGAAEEAQARENYYERRASTNDALTALYQREAQLRRLVGLPVNDGRLIRPEDPALTPDGVPEWEQSLAEALTHRLELRRQKTAVEALCKQLYAARKLAKPQLDFVSAYGLNAFGDNLFNINNNGPFPSAYETQFSGEQTAWNVGFEFSMPLGVRAALSQLRALELRVAKAKAVLAAQELEISHELAHAFQQVDRWMAATELQQARQDAAQQRLSAVEADYRVAGRTTVDLLVRSQASLIESALAYQRSLVEYRKAIVELNYRSGRILSMHNISLAEAVWDPDAYATTLERNLMRVQQRPLEGTTGMPSEVPPSSSPALVPDPEPLPALDVVPSPEHDQDPGASTKSGVSAG